MDVARHAKSRLLQLDVQGKLNFGFYEFGNDSLVIGTWNGDSSRLFAKSFLKIRERSSCISLHRGMTFTSGYRD